MASEGEYSIEDLDALVDAVPAKLEMARASLESTRPELDGDPYRANCMALLGMRFDVSGDLIGGPTGITVTPATFDDGSSFGVFDIDNVPICFFGGVAFHPDRPPADRTSSPLALDYPVRVGPHDRRLFILDTGWIADEPPPCPADIENFPSSAASANRDLVRGHGPAIVDIAHSIMGMSSQGSYDDQRVTLRQPDYFSGALEAATLLPALTAELMPTPWLVRAIDLRSVNDALTRILETEIADGDILNLSLGTVVEQSVIDNPRQKPEFERLLDLMDSFLAREITVVAAAGNHASEAPMWPAAHEGVIAVGSGERCRDGALKIHDFSGRGTWVQYYADGERVPVKVKGKFPDATNSGDRSATWTGTSFAAPKVAALAAQGELLSDPDLEVWHRP